MGSTDIDRWFGTVLGLVGILIGTLAGLIGVGAVAVDVFGADRQEVAYLAISAALWLLVGGYYAWWGNRIQQGRWGRWN